jgi:hypothetical protein
VLLIAQIGFFAALGLADFIGGRSMTAPLEIRIQRSPPSVSRPSIVNLPYFANYASDSPALNVSCDVQAPGLNVLSEAARFAAVGREERNGMARIEAVSETPPGITLLRLRAPSTEYLTLHLPNGSPRDWAVLTGQKKPASYLSSADQMRFSSRSRTEVIHFPD